MSRTMSDVKVQFSILQRKLVHMGFTSWDLMTEQDVLDGSPYAYCLFLRFILTFFHDKTSYLLQKYEWFIVEDNNLNFTKSLFRVLREEYQYTPSIDWAQFSKSHFTCAKLSICNFLIDTWRGKA
ncbi:hypothetical protein STCU_00356 [Strigomonas culicis]|uniref:Centrosomal CEP44 domain-containing protein n=1 Tax=Strigomonas culicis TaxID=28005 RepID=S9V735_9TRYP|nr:hypothetical protein STCU_00356 [Strigomonas culicis]|eukprot:EPY36889.1 hypothetical protein STCU_00356 [Strigomonas culicis]